MRNSLISFPWTFFVYVGWCPPGRSPRLFWPGIYSTCLETLPKCMASRQTQTIVYYIVRLSCSVCSISCMRRNLFREPTGDDSPGSSMENFSFISTKVCFKEHCFRYHTLNLLAAFFQYFPTTLVPWLSALKMKTIFLYLLCNFCRMLECSALKGGWKFLPSFTIPSYFFPFRWIWEHDLILSRTLYRYLMTFWVENCLELMGPPSLGRGPKAHFHDRNANASLK